MRRQDVVAFCALVSLALLNCADLTAVPMATFGSAPRPADDIAAYAERMIAEAALGSIQTTVQARHHSCMSWTS